MKLLLKFNLVLVVVFAMGIAATGYFSRELLQRNAREEIYESAKLLIDSALAVREYTSRNIAPLLETQIRYEFRPEMVSAFSANEVLKNLRAANPEYKQFLYREATLNPTNPANKAVEWERAGVDILWVAEAYGFDAPTLMRYLAARTETAQIGSAMKAMK